MPWPHTSAGHYHAHLGLPNIGRAIYWIGLLTSARCVVWSLVVVRLSSSSTAKSNIISNIYQIILLNSIQFNIGDYSSSTAKSHIISNIYQIILLNSIPFNIGIKLMKLDVSILDDNNVKKKTLFDVSYYISRRR